MPTRSKRGTVTSGSSIGLRSVCELVDDLGLSLNPSVTVVVLSGRFISVFFLQGSDVARVTWHYLVFGHRERSFVIIGVDLLLYAEIPKPMRYFADILLVPLV